MGLSFHYKGQIKEAKMLAPLVTDVIDFAKAHSFDYQTDVFEQAFPEGELTDYLGDDQLYGIAFSPKECEPIYLTFVRNGRLCSPIQLVIQTSPEDDFFYLISTKTQYAGAEAHALVIDFLRYLSEKYFSEFELQDEGKYWETQDKNLLIAEFDKLQRSIDRLSAMTEMMPRKEGESLEDFIKRMAEETRKKL
ncbi:MAG TPA: hypothetical protein ENK85_08145 [Saprospiraceae bacterium]|nr:hypothetical protein [Saprospiraceae bacterium]